MRPGPYRWPQSRRSLPDCCFQVSKRYFKALTCPGNNGTPLDTAKYPPWIILSRSKKLSRGQSTLWRNWPPATTVNMVSPQDSEEVVRLNSLGSHRRFQTTTLFSEYSYDSHQTNGAPPKRPSGPLLRGDHPSAVQRQSPHSSRA
jgi:hypothetical protein